jgi:hypothetical protein
MLHPEDKRVTADMLTKQDNELLLLGEKLIAMSLLWR